MEYTTDPSTSDRQYLLHPHAFRVKRDRDVTMLSHNAEIRFFKAILNLRDKFRTTYACNKEYCPMIKERMAHHILTTHPQAKTCDKGKPCPNVSLSLHQLITKQSRCNNSSCRVDHQSKHHLKVLDTDAENDSSNTDVKNDVMDLFKDYPDTQKTYDTKELKNNLVHNLVDKIEILVNEDVTDDEKIKTEIDNVINKTLGESPSKTDRMISFVNGMRSKLCLIVKSQLKKKRCCNGANESNKSRVSGIEPMQTKSQILKYELQNLLKDYPINTVTLNSKDYKEKLIDNLTNDIYRIINDKSIPTEVKKTEIYNVFEKLNTKYPISTKEDIAVLENIRSKILNIVKGKRSASKTKKTSRISNYSSTSSRQDSDVINNKPKRVDHNVIKYNNVTKDIKNIFNDFPALRQWKNKDNPMRKLIEDVNKVISNNKQYNESKIKENVDSLIDKLSMQLPALKKDVKFKEDIKVRVLKTIKDSYKESDSRPTYNNYSKGNFGKSGDLGTSSNYSKRGNIPKAGTASSSIISRSDSNLLTSQVSIKKDPKSELRLILESSVYPQIKDERKNSLIDRLFYDIQAVKISSKHKNDSEIKEELQKLIDKLPLWYPGAKRDQLKYVNDLKEKLYNFIKNPTYDSSNINRKRNISRPNESKLSVTDDSVLTIFTDESSPENHVRKWVKNIRNQDFMAGVNHEDLIKSITNRIEPILQNNSCGKKIILKGAILEILSYIPTTFKCNLRLQKLVNELVSTLNYAYRNKSNECCNTESRTMFFNIYRDFSKIPITKMVENINVRHEIADLILCHSDSVSIDDEFELENDIIQTLTKNTDASERDILLTAKNITKCLCNTVEAKIYKNQPTTKSVAIFTSSTDNSRLLQQKQKLNDEEIDYIKNVSVLVREWMNTLPVQFDAPEERGFKESMVSELAGQIMDIEKLDQLVPFKNGEKDNTLKYYLYIWILKFNCFDLQDLLLDADEFLFNLKYIPVPNLTKSHCGTRQMMDNIRHMEGEKGWKEDYVPKGIDVLKDEISLWVHEQPRDLFTFNKNTRNDKIHELATVIQPKIARKENENVIAQDVGKWLNKNLKNNANMHELQRDLKDRVINLPQDTTLRANLDNKLEEKRLIKEQQERLKNLPPSVPTDSNKTDLDLTMKDFISKFIEHNYDVDDPTARAAFNYLLKRELQRLSPQSQQEVYDKANITDTFIVPPDKLFCELEYIKIISDWLKNVPLEDYFKRPHNYERIDFILGLARTLSEVENDRARNPCCMDYDMYTASLIETHIMNLPMPEGYKHIRNIDILVTQLLSKLDNTREVIRTKMAEGFGDKSGVNDENLGDFLEEFIRIHGNDIADNEVKMEAWSIRLIREIRKIVQEKGPEVTKAHVYKQIVTVPKPGDDTIQRFDTELIYIGEITEWMKNLAFKSLSQEEYDNRKRMVCDLAEYLAAKEAVTIEDQEVTEYLKQWISELPLDTSHEIVISLLIEQLINRINRKKEEKIPKETSTICKSSKCTMHKSKITKSKSISKLNENPGTIVVEAIEKWSKSLPMYECCTGLKSEAAKKMYQKVGEFNSDPGIYNDDSLYETFLKDEIETIVEKLPNGAEIKAKYKKNNEKLLKTLVHAKAVAKEMSAGDNYKQKLEHTIDASIPNPVTNKQTYDPAFEIYKSRLADMFILENFDYGNDQVKTKYEKRIREEIDRFFEGAQHKNTKPLSKDEIYNELYSNLFKVPIPNETSTMDEVEKIKTRQVIDTWFEELPVKETDDVIELLEWDKKLDALTKRIHEMEKSPNSDEKILKEISKWLGTMPILPCQLNNINEYAAKLKNQLKSSENERKCVSEKDAKGKKGKSGKSKSKTNICDPKCCNTITADINVEKIAPRRNAADTIVEQVELWCSKVAIVIPPQSNQEAQSIRNELVRKIIVKISEINMNPTVCNDDFLYKQTLDIELDKILSEVPTCCTFNIVDRKIELIETINAVKPLINEEKDKINYMDNLNKTVIRELTITPEKITGHEDEFNDLKEEIVENYVQLNYDKDDDVRQVYKQKIHDAVDKFLTNIIGEKYSNPLMKRNQLICELNKVPIPNDNLIAEEVHEIRIKEQLTEFFEENHLNDVKDKPVDQIKRVLAKKLTAIEASGHTEENDRKMVKEISRTVRRLSQELNPEKIDGFVNKLKVNEHERKRRLSSASPSSKKSTKVGKKPIKSIINKQYYGLPSEKSIGVLPGCAKKSQEYCPFDDKKDKPMCTRPYTKIQCDPKDDPYCYKNPKYCP